MDKDQIEALQEDAEKNKDLASLATSMGGKRLIEDSVDDILTILTILANQYQVLPEMELRAHCASLQAKLSLLATLQGAPGKYEAAIEQIKQTLNREE